jgi:DNA-binding NtrC family response regulator
MEPCLGRILLVEDEPALARVFARALNAAGFQVEQARDGMEGLERLLQRPFDALLSDISMPRLTGLELLEKVRQAQPDLPVVLMTAHLDAERYGRARDMGTVRYLLKPVGLQQLTRAMDSAVKLGAAWRRARPRKSGAAEAPVVYGRAPRDAADGLPRG